MSENSLLTLPGMDLALKPASVSWEPEHSTGILSSRGIRYLLAHKNIVATAETQDQQIQPASLDLRLGPTAYRVRASFLPGRNNSVMDKIKEFSMHKIDLSNGAVLEKGCVYLVPLMESLKLLKGYSAVANPKSSTGRLDIFTRLITDGATEFERVREGYVGRLYAEIAPRTFSVLVRQGDRLNQIRFRKGKPTNPVKKLRKLHERDELVEPIQSSESAPPIRRGGMEFTIDLAGDSKGLVGYKAKKNTNLIDISKINYYDAFDYWDPVIVGKDGRIILDPNDFYILASKERVRVPPDHAAEMVAYDTLVGEFRVHYAGFFDPGFGYSNGTEGGTKAVLEVRSYEVPFMIEPGQVVGRLVYERLTDVPDRLYGQDIGSNYGRQGLTLSKQFRR